MTTVKNKILWGTALSALAFATAIVIVKLRNKLNFSTKINRMLVACRPTGCNMLQGMSASKFDVPMFIQSFYQEKDIVAIKEKMAEIRFKYATILDAVSKLTNLPEILIRAFIFIESRGDQNAINGNAIGLMQIDRFGANDMLYLEHKNNRLTDPEKTVLRKHIGTRLDMGIMKMKYMGYSQNITNTDLKNPEFNILVGSIFLGILIDEHTENGQVRLDKVIARYNRGYFSKGYTGDKNTVYANMPTITKSYILKLLGTRGVLDIMV